MDEIQFYLIGVGVPLYSSIYIPTYKEIILIILTPISGYLY